LRHPRYSRATDHRTLAEPRLRKADELGRRAARGDGEHADRSGVPGLMALSAIDRLLTVAVTATLTSAAWIVILSDTERETPGEANQTESSTLPAPVSTPVSSESEGLLVPVA